MHLHTLGHTLAHTWTLISCPELRVSTFALFAQMQIVYKQQEQEKSEGKKMKENIYIFTRDMRTPPTDPPLLALPFSLAHTLNAPAIRWPKREEYMQKIAFNIYT